MDLFLLFKEPCGNCLRGNGVCDTRAAASSNEKSFSKCATPAHRACTFLKSFHQLSSPPCPIRFSSQLTFSASSSPASSSPPPPPPPPPHSISALSVRGSRLLQSLITMATAQCLLVWKRVSLRGRRGDLTL